MRSIKPNSIKLGTFEDGPFLYTVTDGMNVAVLGHSASKGRTFYRVVAFGHTLRFEVEKLFRFPWSARRRQ